MKTNKEIKPFKMRCSKTEIIKVTNILDSLGISKYRCSVYDADHPVIVFSQEMNEYGLLNYIHFNSYSGDELTYSEFMKLYGEEEEVFTRENMKDFAVYVASGYSRIYLSEGHRYVYKGREHDWNNSFTTNEILTKFLSERTND